MSYPNGGQPGQPGQPQQWGQPQNGGQQTWGQAAGAGFNNVKSTSGFNPSTVRPGQWIALGLWLLTIIGLSIPFIGGQTYDSGYGTSYQLPSYSGWNGGLLVMFFIFSLLAAISVAIELFVPSVKLPFPLAFVTGGLLALAGLFGLIEFLTDLDALKYYSVGGWVMLILSLVAIAGGVLEIMHAMKQPKAGGNAAAAQWGQPAAGQWGAPQTGGQPAQPQGQWGAPQQGENPQWGQAPQQGQNGQWGNPQA